MFQFPQIKEPQPSSKVTMVHFSIETSWNNQTVTTGDPQMTPEEPTQHQSFIVHTYSL